jgi:hypothetical protein
MDEHNHFEQYNEKFKKDHKIDYIKELIEKYELAKF